MRPGPLGEIEAGPAAGVMERGVQRQRAGFGIEPQHEQPVLLGLAGDRHAMRCCVVNGPVRHEAGIDHRARDFDRMRPVANIEHHQPMQDRHRLDQEMPNDRWHAAERTRELPDQL